MSEFSEKHFNIKTNIGSPPGYVGVGDDGRELAKAVRERPFTVMLMRMENHPEIFILILQILDEGRLVDSKGKVFWILRSSMILSTLL